jgi:hypothetical protein
MAGENVSSVADATKDKDTDDEGRQRSTIAFPYNHLNDAIEVARAIHSHAGSGDGDDSQVSAWMDQSPKSSGFRIQVGAARMFGLIETTAGRHKLSPLGRMVVDPLQEREARAKAFLMVPLYKALYENHKTGVLPPAAALERDIVSLGVAEKQKERARQVFERSADQAGFFEHGKNRLVMPAVAIREDEHADGDEETNGNGGGGGNGTLDPLISALIQKLPKPKSTWAADQRVMWLQMLSMAFQMAYGPVETIEIKKSAASRPE